MKDAVANAKHFFWMVRTFSLKIALDYYVISFCKWFVGAKSIRLKYEDTDGKHVSM